MRQSAAFSDEGHAMIQRLALAAAFAVSLTCAPALAEWPDRPLKTIVPFQPGSSSDVIARIVVGKLGDRLGKQVVVENRVGGSTIIGTEAIARSAPDGYTIGLANTSTHATALALSGTLPFDPVKDFTPVAMIGSSPFLYLGAKKLPATMKELVAYAKANPGKLSYASAGPATLSHLAGELIKKLAGVEIAHVPYRGTAQSVVDVLEGRMDLLVGVINSTQEHVRSGKITAFATLDKVRTPALPDVPTIAEAGLPGGEAALWTAIVLPAGVPAAIVDKLNRELNAVVNMPEIQESLRKQGVEPEPGSQEVVAARIKADIAKWSDLIVSMKIKG
jgi:tripartite-type tricarboxylate transporter receptor subunit TctC